MTAQTIQRYQKISTGNLKVRAQKSFNKFVRERDQLLPCISCGSRNTATASHFYSAGKYNHMRFLEDNCHLSCVKCNYFLSGNLLPYRENLIKKIGLARVEKLDFLASQKSIQKTDRFLLIEMIEKYK